MEFEYEPLGLKFSWWIPLATSVHHPRKSPQSVEGLGRFSWKFSKKKGNLEGSTKGVVVESMRIPLDIRLTWAPGLLEAYQSGGGGL